MARKSAPKWLLKKVYKINLRLINECDMDWDGVIEFWEELIAETKREKAETKKNESTH